MTLGPDTRTRRVGTLVIHLVAAAVPDGPELLHDWGYAKGVPRELRPADKGPAGQANRTTGLSTGHSSKETPHYGAYIEERIESSTPYKASNPII
jgi:hypothetical protein